jgi:aspartyl-tRNA(Asn)/glutamyl-tRNA(Gln) amidotransferase subunit B
VTTTEFEPVIGLEIHAELQTRTKMFCGCRVVDPLSNDPNVAICPVCVGLPGALPVINQRALEMAVRVGLALNCKIHEVTWFARKNYFYPDLPKGYQISQFDNPIAYQGWIEVPGEGDRAQRIRIRRAHLEEDTAKLFHVDATYRDAEHTRVDFNRSGVPLLEIVTEPDMRSSETALAYATRIRSILRYLGVNSGDMEKGVLRFEANVSIRPRGSQELNTRTEIKNLNSFRTLVDAIDFEVRRQTEIVRSGGRVAQQTLGWNEARSETYSQRSKEEAHDYRYFPEPDLPPFHVEPDWVEDVRREMPELPDAKYQRFQTQFQLSPYDAQVLSAERAVAEYFEEAVAAFRGSPKIISNWITGELFRLLKENDTPIEQVKVPAPLLAALVQQVEDRKINANSGKEVLAEMFQTGQDPFSIIQERGLAAISDTSELSRIVNEVLDKNPTQVSQYLGGKEAVFQWLVGQVMRATKGKASPDVARQLLTDALAARKQG